ncbi:deoxyguanosinetriphosphate triphosphohydrolase [bacterium BMS3Abin07]|nr:deoxyguanosinetriphosphate triphosphohydrolase [bacterium BMS3Abin07]GBE33174.1 deoxyguanosinetriphosphate triphosphohydrolase [bacterium BMS3Bbin05]HDL19758.1 deoxyguanosinetriphosphate triphosphohydrolase [Nitrospirota bacterium]HDO22998.1 deoxyguanosinetriphosphate triphosphohydrolase [Nitrospirota bacterium]HDZ87608.1 deoxyguanosinetriphosphate triphosphohydrolase [Nitrospirota bacterium]
MNLRKQTEEFEKDHLHPRACRSSESKGRHMPEKEGDIRTCYQRDRDRIIHSKAFRRLKDKTQVFLAPKGDHYRTRLIHVLEVSQIARTISRALRLNEDLTEAIALGHDLGHTPFGHAGESVLDEIHPGGFDHYVQSLRVVDVLEKDGKGLNLTSEVRDGIVKHSIGQGVIMPDDSGGLAETLEGQAVRLSDIIAYVNHDLDDALRAGIIKKPDIPANLIRTVGNTHSKRIDTMVKDLINSTLLVDTGKIVMSGEVTHAIRLLRDFLFERVYESESIMAEFNKAKGILKRIYEHYVNSAEHLPAYHHGLKAEDYKEYNNMYKHQAVCDFIAGMTDHYAISTYERLFLPQQWKVL